MTCVTVAPHSRSSTVLGNGLHAGNVSYCCETEDVPHGLPLGSAEEVDHPCWIRKWARLLGIQTGFKLR